MLVSYRRIMELVRKMFASHLAKKSWESVTLTVILLEMSLHVPLSFRTRLNEIFCGWGLMESISIKTLHSMQRQTWDLSCGVSLASGFEFVKTWVCK